MGIILASQAPNMSRAAGSLKPMEVEKPAKMMIDQQLPHDDEQDSQASRPRRLRWPVHLLLHVPHLTRRTPKRAARRAS